MKIGINVNISRLLWGQIGGSIKNNDPIKTILINPTPPVWGQDWGQDYPTQITWDLLTKIYLYFQNKLTNRK
jgi:hypothetical protein